MNNTSPPRFTAAAGTKLAGTSSLDTVIIISNERTLQSETVFVHATLLDQALAHCPRFLTAACYSSGGFHSHCGCTSSQTN